jgi:hemolysin activation/secretion protein
MPIPAYQLAVYYQHGGIAQSVAMRGGTITGAGLGLIYSGKEDYSLRLDYAWKLHNSVEDLNESSSRFWVLAAKYF